MKVFRSQLLLTDAELEALSEQYTEKTGEKTVVIPTYLVPENEKTFFLCDGYACEGPCPDFCKHTSDVRHARNFFQKHDGTWWELNEEHREVGKS